MFAINLGRWIQQTFSLRRPLRLTRRPRAGRRPDVAWPVLMLMAAGGAVLFSSTWYILTGKTTIDAKGIRQDWLFSKEFSWHEISRAGLVRMPLIPRLVLATQRGPLKAVHGGSPALLAAFREIDAFYRR